MFSLFFLCGGKKIDKESSMNEDLIRWVNESKKEVKKSKSESKKSHKKPSGMCQICRKRKATSVCLKCNRSVCSSCYFKIINVCKECIPQHIAKKWDGSNPDWEKELGVDWVD